MNELIYECIVMFCLLIFLCLLLSIPTLIGNSSKGIKYDQDNDIKDTNVKNFWK